MADSRPPLFFNFRGGLLSSLFHKNPSKCLKTAISLKLSTFSHLWVLKVKLLIIFRNSIDVKTYVVSHSYLLGTVTISSQTKLIHYSLQFTVRSGDEVHNPDPGFLEHLCHLGIRGVPCNVCQWRWGLCHPWRQSPWHGRRSGNCWGMSTTLPRHWGKDIYNDTNFLYLVTFFTFIFRKTKLICIKLLIGWVTLADKQWGFI